VGCLTVSSLIERGGCLIGSGTFAESGARRYRKPHRPGPGVLSHTTGSAAIIPKHWFGASNFAHERCSNHGTRTQEGEEFGGLREVFDLDAHYRPANDNVFSHRSIIRQAGVTPFGAFTTMCYPPADGTPNHGQAGRVGGACGSLAAWFVRTLAPPIEGWTAAPPEPCFGYFGHRRLKPI